MGNNSEKLSQKSYAMIRLFRYITFALIIIMLFLPIIRIQTTDDRLGLKATASVSPFQVLIGDTYVEAKIELENGDKESNEMLNGLIGSNVIKVNVIHELFDFNGGTNLRDSVITVLKIGSIVGGAIIALISMVASNSLSKRLADAPTDQNEITIQNDTYILHVFTGLPKIFELIETFILVNTIFPLMILGLFNVVGVMTLEIDMAWQMDIVWTVIMFIIPLLLKKAIITKIIFTKERKTIQLYNARYNAPHTHTFSSDMNAIAGIFGAQKPTESTEESELYKYKKLLDDGIITQEEYEQKKKELLNL